MCTSQTRKSSGVGAHVQAMTRPNAAVQTCSTASLGAAVPTASSATITASAQQRSTVTICGGVKRSEIGMPRILPSVKQPQNSEASAAPPASPVEPVATAKVGIQAPKEASAPQ